MRWMKKVVGRDEATSFDEFLRKMGTSDPRVASQVVDSWRLREYPCWRPRLLQLQGEFDTALPRTFSQWWYDGRKRGDWLTVVTAVLGSALAFLILVYTFVSTITGGIAAHQSVVANQFAAAAAAAAAAASAAPPPGPPAAEAPAVVMAVTATGTVTTTVTLPSSTATRSGADPLVRPRAFDAAPSFTTLRVPARL